MNCGRFLFSVHGWLPRLHLIRSGKEKIKERQGRITEKGGIRKGKLKDDKNGKRKGVKKGKIRARRIRGVEKGKIPKERKV